jgi:hypothetical protein
VPPLATTLALYATPTTAGGSLAVVIFKPGAMVIDNVAFAVPARRLESFTCTVKVFLPAAVGVPEIAPLLLSERPAGKVPLIMLKV